MQGRSAQAVPGSALEVEYRKGEGRVVESRRVPMIKSDWGKRVADPSRWMFDYGFARMERERERRLIKRKVLAFGVEWRSQNFDRLTTQPSSES